MGLVLACEAWLGVGRVCVDLSNVEWRRLGRGQNNPRLKQQNWRQRAGGPPGRVQPGFTLLELLITIGIIAVLLSLMLPVVSGAMRSARSFKCKMSLRSVAFDFSLYGDPELHGDRGRDDRLGDRFTLSAFIDSQYGAADFWRYGNDLELPSQWPRLRDDGSDPMRCAEVKGDVVLRPRTPCVDGALQTPQNVSYTFNMRLAYTIIKIRESERLFPGKLDMDTLAQSNVPLAWDVDGAEASMRESTPVLSAPSLKDSGPFANERYWFPSMRHSKTLNVAFVDGHVDSSRTPEVEPGWRWDYQAMR